MSLIKEYIKALAQAVKHPELVIEGWVNDAKLNRGQLSEEETAEILRRRAICETCPFMSKNAQLSGNYFTKRQDEHCIHCGCPIAKKTASLESNCGIEVYNQNNKTKQLPLKWEVYVKPQENDEHSKTS